MLAGCAKVEDSKSASDAKAGCNSDETMCGGQCVNTASDVNHCGECNVSCGECLSGMCVSECDPGLSSCEGACVDLQTDTNNCGVCGNSCGACEAGMCLTGSVWEESFTQGMIPSAQCNSYQSFLTALPAPPYAEITLYGSNDPQGITCSFPKAIRLIVEGLQADTEFHVTCDGHVWSHCKRSHTTGSELWIDAPAMCDNNNCPDPGYIIRPCTTSQFLFGGINTGTCSSSPDQSIGLRIL